MVTMDRISREAEIGIANKPIVTAAFLAELFEEPIASICHFEEGLKMPRIRPGVFDLCTSVKWYCRQMKRELDQTGNEDLAQAKAEQANARAKRYILENDILQGNAVPLDELKKDLMIVAEELKNALYKMASVVSSEIANINSTSLAYDVIDGGIVDALNQVATRLDEIGEKGHYVDEEKVKKKMMKL